MLDNDPFYQTLPYTLTPEQSHPAYVIFGTGLQESLIAAYLSKMHGQPGLVIDTDKTYGSCLKTVTFKELHELDSLSAAQPLYRFVTPKEFSEKNKSFFQESIENKKYRHYNIDIEPSLFFASSIACECLKQADMDKYMDFRLVSNILHVSSGRLQAVPLSKGKIFESKELSLVEKKTLLMSLHKLIKIYQRYAKVEEDPNSTKEFDKDFGDIEESLYQ